MVTFRVFVFVVATIASTSWMARFPRTSGNGKMREWRTEEQQVKFALDGLVGSENTDWAPDASECSNSQIRPIYCPYRRIPLKKPSYSE